MNVYDQAHSLATAIKESEEFKQYDQSKKEVEANPELDAAIKDFMGKQFELQTQQMMGQEMDAEALSKLQQLSAHPDAGSVSGAVSAEPDAFFHDDGRRI